MMETAIVLFTRDLRVHDHPALSAACSEARRVVPLFVLDETILRSRYAAANRLRFLVEALADLRATLRGRGGQLVIRRGDPVTETMRLADQTGAEGVFASADVSTHASLREHELEKAARQQHMDLRLCPGMTVVPPGEITPTTGDHYKVFTPYWRSWRTAAWRDVASAPRAMRVPSGLRAGRLPTLTELTGGSPSPDLMTGGETAGRARVDRWLDDDLAGYGDRHDDLAGDRTSRLSPYLHFGCLSPREVAGRATDRDGGEPFVRQLCWRDFYHQITAAFPEISWRDYRPHGDRWHHDDAALQAWKEGCTGFPIVDAGMRQLTGEGWMHNRARLVVASFLTKNLYIDWRSGGQHFIDLLLDGDIPNNYGNWQWMAGTGNDTRPNRVLNPIRQAHRYDPSGDYVRRYVPELAAVSGKAVHEPWKLDPSTRRELDYPRPLIDPEEKPAFIRARSG